MSSKKEKRTGQRNCKATVPEHELPSCLYCGQRWEFGKQIKSDGYLLYHFPTGLCPARSEIYCDDFEFALKVLHIE